MRQLLEQQILQQMEKIHEAMESWTRVAVPVLGEYRTQWNEIKKEAEGASPEMLFSFAIARHIDKIVGLEENSASAPQVPFVLRVSPPKADPPLAEKGESSPPRSLPIQGGITAVRPPQAEAPLPPENTPIEEPATATYPPAEEGYVFSAGDAGRWQELQVALELAPSGTVALDPGTITFTVNGGLAQEVLPDDLVRTQTKSEGNATYLVDLNQRRSLAIRLFDWVGIPADAVPSEEGLVHLRLIQMSPEERQEAFARVRERDVLFVEETQSLDEIPEDIVEKLTIVRLSAEIAESLTPQKVEGLIRAAERALGRNLHVRDLTLTDLQESGRYSLLVVTGT